MDERRLDTAGALAAGVLGMPVPVTEVPTDRETVDGCGEDYAYIGDAAVAAALDAGHLVGSPNYYGVVYAWKAGEGAYRGTLLQYRAITEDPTFATAEEAAAWFGETYRRTDG